MKIEYLTKNTITKLIKFANNNFLEPLSIAANNYENEFHEKPEIIFHKNGINLKPKSKALSQIHYILNSGQTYFYQHGVSVGFQDNEFKPIFCPCMCTPKGDGIYEDISPGNNI